MECAQTAIPGVVVLTPRVFGDERGFFFESFNQLRFQALVGERVTFVQENHSRSMGGVLRGLHYQIRQAQGKLVRVLRGEIFDVAVDIRRSSPTFKHWVGVRLSSENKQQLWIPEGFAHGFYVLSPVAEVLYLTTDYYAPEHERAIIWNDADLAIDWPLTATPVLSDKDRQADPLAAAELFS